jgi:hypothetical protein
MAYRAVAGVVARVTSCSTGRYSGAKICFNILKVVVRNEVCAQLVYE